MRKIKQINALVANKPTDLVGGRRTGYEQKTVLPKARKSLSESRKTRQSEDRAFDGTPSCEAGFHRQYERRGARLLILLSITLLGSLIINPAGAAETPDVRELLKYAASGDLNSVRKAIESGTEINAYDPTFKATALHNAASQGHLHIVEWIISKGGNVEQQDAKGQTPLIWAAYFGKTKVIKALLKAGANPNHLPTKGSTALTVAIQSGQLSAVKILLDNGANLSLTDVNGVTAEQAAKLRNNQQIQMILTDRGIAQ